MPASPLNTGNAVKFTVPGYVKGNMASYAGVTIESTNSDGQPVSLHFNSGTFATDIVMAMIAARGASGSGAFSTAWVFDSSIDDGINDALAAQPGS